MFGLMVVHMMEFGRKEKFQGKASLLGQMENLMKVYI